MQNLKNSYELFKFCKMRQIAFDQSPIVESVCKHTLQFTLTNIPGAKIAPLTDQDFDQVDSIDFAIIFQPPLTVDQATSAHVEILHYKTTKVIFGQYVLPPILRACGAENGGAENGGVDTLEIQADELNYLLTETHQLHFNRTNETITIMFVKISSHASAALQPDVDMHMRFFGQFGTRFKFVDWFPPNVDPAAYGLRIDPRSIPQRTLLWFKLRGEVTGTKAYALLGFWVPSKAEDPQYSFFKPAKFSEFSKAAMRLGSASEDAALLTYFMHYKDRTFEEVGWCTAPAPLPKTWGASPDGVVWVPAAPAGGANPPAPAGRAGSQGALEIKTSRSKLSMEAYFFPQVYMEMISLNVQWTDLIRYKPGHGAHIYRIHRDPEIEARLIPLWKRALANAQRLQDIVQEQAYVDMREYFYKAAARMDPVDKIPEPTLLIDQYKAYKEKLLRPVPAPPVLLRDPAHLLVKQAKEVQEKIRNKRHKSEVAALLLEQLNECGKLLKECI